MNDRIKTDFLCASSSFLRGLGSVWVIDGKLYDYNTSDDPDNTAIASDWGTVGQDIRDALKGAPGKLGVVLSNE
jgi:hypothetical protein